MTDTVLTERLWRAEGSTIWVKRVALVAFGIAALTVGSQIKIPVPGTPVEISMGTFAVLSVGAAYGVRLGLATVLGWMLVGALGFDVFQQSASGVTGLPYMMGATGGYLLGYVLATLALGVLARKGWDRGVLSMALAMLIGNALIYVPGLAWLSTFANGWEQTLAWGLTPFLLGDAMKLALAALIFPALWKLVGNARA